MKKNRIAAEKTVVKKTGTAAKGKTPSILCRNVGDITVGNAKAERLSRKLYRVVKIRQS